MLQGFKKDGPKTACASRTSTHRRHFTKQADVPRYAAWCRWPRSPIQERLQLDLPRYIDSIEPEDLQD